MYCVYICIYMYTSTHIYICSFVLKKKNHEFKPKKKKIFKKEKKGKKNKNTKKNPQKIHKQT